MANKLSLKRLLGYRDFFPNAQSESKESLARQLGKETIFKTVCYFLSLIGFNAVPPIVALLQKWFTFNEFKFFQSPSYHYIVERLKWIRYQDRRSNFGLCAEESLLNLFIWTKSRTDIPADTEQTTADSTLISFKLLLLFNDDVLDNYEIASKSVNISDVKRRMQGLLLAMSFPQFDLINVDLSQILVTQFYKAFKLLDFISTTETYQNLYEHFLQEFNCESKEEYLTRITQIVILSLKNDKPGWTVLDVPVEEQFSKDIVLLDKLSVAETDSDTIDQNDYLEIRNLPYQKIAPGQYRIIFDLFLVKKVYNGLVFKLSELSRTNKGLFKKDFLGSLRNEFSEAILLYEVLEMVFSKEAAVRVTGNEFKQAGLSREADYYTRLGSEILLFESKDFFIKGEVKLSYDFNQIEAELRNNRLEKAVIQLTENIKRAFLKQLVLDDDYDTATITITPVIIVHDSLYGAAALNYWVHYWMQDSINQLKKESALLSFDFDRVKPVTIIEIDTLILYKAQFEAGIMNLHDLIVQFQQYVEYGKSVYTSDQEIEEHALRSAISFSEFVRDFGQKNGIVPDMKELMGLFSQYGIR